MERLEGEVTQREKNVSRRRTVDFYIKEIAVNEEILVSLLGHGLEISWEGGDNANNITCYFPTK